VSEHRARTAPIAPEPTERTTPAPSHREKPSARPKASPRPKAPRQPSGPARIAGTATWYCQPGRSRCTRGFPADGAYAAAGPELRAALGRWRGKTVFVNGVPVKLIDSCACGGDHVIDVYRSTWLKIPNPDQVTIKW
jgi:hypothetical protein